MKEYAAGIYVTPTGLFLKYDGTDKYYMSTLLEVVKKGKLGYGGQVSICSWLEKNNARPLNESPIGKIKVQINNY